MPHRLKQVNIRLRRADVPAAYREAEILGPSDVYDWMRELFPDTGRDYMVAANLDARGHPLNFMVANMQTVQRSMAGMIRKRMMKKKWSQTAIRMPVRLGGFCVLLLIRAGSLSLAYMKK